MPADVSQAAVPAHVWLLCLAFLVWALMQVSQGRFRHVVSVCIGKGHTGLKPEFHEEEKKSLLCWA